MLTHPIARAVLLFLAFIAGGVLLFVFDAYEVGSARFNSLLLITMTLIKLGYFITSLLRWIRRSGQEEVYRRHLLLFLLLSVLLIICSYAIDYYCLQRIYPDSFHLPFGAADLVGQLLTFFYLSAGRFTTAGGSEVYATASLAQAYVVSEILLAYFTTVLIIANVGLLQTLLSPARRDEPTPPPAP